MHGETDTHILAPVPGLLSDLAAGQRLELLERVRGVALRGVGRGHAGHQGGQGPWGRACHSSCCVFVCVLAGVCSSGSVLLTAACWVCVG